MAEAHQFNLVKYKEIFVYALPPTWEGGSHDL
jgi:hypothetical protein